MTAAMQEGRRGGRALAGGIRCRSRAEKPVSLMAELEICDEEEDVPLCHPAQS